MRTDEGHHRQPAVVELLLDHILSRVFLLRQKIQHVEPVIPYICTHDMCVMVKEV
jgi:hypothetical protein